jgi:hypothetical protein
MKIIFGLLGVLMLSLLPSSSHAEQADYVVVKRDTFAGAKNLASLDEMIRTYTQPIDTYFKQIGKNEDGNVRLGNDEVLIIKGGNGTIGRELDGYKDRIIQNSSQIMTWNVAAYGCYVKPTIGKAKTYVMVVGDSTIWASNITQWGGNRGWCTGTWVKLIQDTSGVKVSDLSRRVKTIHTN